MASKPGFETILITDLHDLDKSSRSHTTPIYQTSTYVYPSAERAQAVFQGKEAAHIYGRWHNPGSDAVERKLAMLEGYDLDQAVDGKLFSTGMAAIAALLEACLKPGDGVITQGNAYGATDELFHFLMEQMNLQVVFIDLHDEALIEQHISELGDRFKLIYAETPSNPTLNAYSISQLAEIAHSHGAKLAVDNTFASPFLQRPLTHGADIVVHSTTKFLNGHGTALGGFVASSDVDWVNGPLYKERKLKGATIGPMDAWLLNNGVKTLALRMRKHSDNSRKVAEFLKGHKAVEKVNYLGFEDHPDHQIAASQMSEYGGVLSFELKGGLEAGMILMQNIRHLTLTATLGTPDTLIQHPASMTHAKVVEEQRLRFGITNGLIRMAVGLEDFEDIQEDMGNALDSLG
jgi:methionine-gamma-lyase